MWPIYLAIFIIAWYAVAMIHELTHYFLGGGGYIRISLNPIKSFVALYTLPTRYTVMAPILVNFLTAFFIVDYLNLGVQSVGEIFVVFLGFASFFYVLGYAIMHLVGKAPAGSDLKYATKSYQVVAVLILFVMYMTLEKYFILTPQFLHLVLPFVF